MSTAIFLVVLFLSWAPLFMPLVDHGENSKITQSTIRIGMVGPILKDNWQRKRVIM